MSAHALESHLGGRSFQERPIPREAAAVATYFFDIITGKRPSHGARNHAATTGWQALQFWKRAVRSAVRDVTVVKKYTFEPGTAEFLFRFDVERRPKFALMQLRQMGLRWQLSDLVLVENGARRRNAS
ncbi:hypothetical protein [Salininema proteolyticum]|uniref:Uncharacterized protein n=1 Tax=Salininema proteolyticum TaxID=1607685 RepID=A0ABV8U655_9ACTN